MTSPGRKKYWNCSNWVGICGRTPAFGLGFVQSNTDSILKLVGRIDSYRQGILGLWTEVVSSKRSEMGLGGQLVRGIDSAIPDSALELLKSSCSSHSAFVLGIH